MSIPSSSSPSPQQPSPKEPPLTPAPESSFLQRCFRALAGCLPRSLVGGENRPMVIPPLPTIVRDDIPPAATPPNPTPEMLSTVAGTPAAQVSSDAMRGTDTPAASLSITAATAAAAATTTTPPKTSDPVQTTSVTTPSTTRIFSSDIELTNFATLAHSRITKIIAHLDPPQSDLERMMPGSRQSYGDFAKSMLIELESRGITREALCLASQRAELDVIAPTDANATRLQLHAPIHAPGWDSVPSSEQWDIATFCYRAGSQIDFYSLGSVLLVTDLQRAKLQAALSPSDQTNFDVWKKQLECIQEFGITKTQMKTALTKIRALNSIQHLDFPQPTIVSPTAKPLTFNDTERKNFALLGGVRISKAAGFLQPPQRDLYLSNPKPGQNYGDFAESILKELENRGITEEEFSAALIKAGFAMAPSYLSDKTLLNQPLTMNGWSDETPDADKWCTDDRQLRNLSYLIGPNFDGFLPMLNLPVLKEAKCKAVRNGDESLGEQAYKQLKILQGFGVTKQQILTALSKDPELSLAYSYLMDEKKLNEDLESKWDSVPEGQKWCSTMKTLIDLSKQIQKADMVFTALNPPLTDLQRMKISASAHMSETHGTWKMKVLQLLQEFGYTRDQLADALEEVVTTIKVAIDQDVRTRFHYNTLAELQNAKATGKLGADIERYLTVLELGNGMAVEMNTRSANQLRRQKFP